MNFIYTPGKYKFNENALITSMKGALKQIKQFIIEQHELRFLNLNDDVMYQLGNTGNGYSPYYEYYKRKYLGFPNRSLDVDLRLSGRFHGGLAPRVNRLSGDIQGLINLPPDRVNLLMSKQFLKFENFVVSQKNTRLFINFVINNLAKRKTLLLKYN